MKFSDLLVAWQRRHGRHGLPWQGTRDAYRIWLSEIMLQQTQVATVVPYYLRFLARFPDVHALAVAPIDDVMSAWAGLGYYSRARNLHRCAQTIVGEHDGAFPSSAAMLEQLPGIGRSTAAAIAVFAFGERAAILDGNVKRVFARHFGVGGYPGAVATERVLWELVTAQLPRADIETYTQGLMDLGATICVRARPRCDACPVRSTCIALRDERIAELPAPRPSRVRPLRAATLALITDSTGAILLERRAPTGIWGGLLSAPEFDAELSDAALQAAIAKRFGLRGSVEQRLESVRHEFSHYSFLMHPRVVSATGAIGVAQAAGLEWLGADEVDHAALPAPLRRLLRTLADRVEDARTT
ncbi:MAG TPA: A/G-specific adenine glycosylase [Burkholderiaceae bacterium]|nr:A/G-specific adenine glycosylase [Burkholderiaceae bacterium]